MTKLSDATRALMEEKGWNADRLAAKARIARSTVFNVLAGREVDLATVRALKRVGVRHPLVEAA